MLTLTCTSTGSPATTVTWTRDGGALTVDGTTYSMTQTVTDRRTSTYENVLSISFDAPSNVGDYTCTVSNALGSDSMDFTIRGTNMQCESLLCIYALAFTSLHIIGYLYLYFINRCSYIWACPSLDCGDLCNIYLYQ